MRILKALAVCMAVMSSTFLTGCCCARRICDWVKRPCYRRYDPPQIISPYTPCAPYVSDSNIAPQPMPNPGYESGN